jgi:hypothetical protein
MKIQHAPRWTVLGLAILCLSSLDAREARGSLSPVPVVPADIALSVDVLADRHTISPYIYGLNFAKSAFADEIDLPLRRWGGNLTTRYNWTTSHTNHGSDWFFHNNTHYNPYTFANETADQWVQQNTASGAQSLISLPMTGWVAKNGDQNACGFPAADYPIQDDFDDESGYPDCGNGTQGGAPLAGNPTNTSQAVTASFVAAWVTHLKNNAAVNGAVQFYGLDNEPDIWFETHRDIWPIGWKYIEFRDRTYQYAAAIKTADPSAKLFGPGVHGWTYYFHSPYDGQREDWDSPDDRNANNDTPFIEWYLQQMRAYELAHGVRLLDYLNVHFYPQNGEALALAGDTNTQALRLRSTRALWDPSYVDESWIGPAGPDGGIVRLLPRLSDWVINHYPGTRLALTEYNWGGLEHINGALAQAEILGLFGREGLDVAALWNYPDESLGYDNFESLPGAYAFRLYRNYNGTGAKFGDVSVSASSADQAQLGVFAAQRTSDGALTLMVINKTGLAQTGQVALAGFSPAPTAQVFRYSAANLGAVVPQSGQPVSTGGFSASFPANSVTLVIVPSSVPLQRVHLPLVRR